MRKIEYASEIKCDAFEQLIESVMSELQNEEMTEFESLNTVVVVLAFKYWQENKSPELNSSIESFDAEYVRLHWQQFCDSEIGKSIGLLKYDEYDEDVIAACLGIMAEYITRHNFDSFNADVIKRWFMSHYNAIVDGGLDKKVKALIKVYRRGKEDSRTNSAEPALVSLNVV